jgi:lysophospholipase L1-like esterase
MILQSVEILTCDDVRVVACFGDSITHRAHWTAPLTKSLYRRHPGGIAIFEAGINGNRLMGGSPSNIMGFAGRKRFSRDILDVVGLTHVIISIGTNDLGHPGVKEWVPIEELPSFEAFTETMSEIASELTSQEVKGIAATIPPRKWRGEMRETREALRLKINEWMLTCGIFARTLDFASTLKNNANDGLWPDFDGGDGLHINSAGGLAIAANIPSSLFVRNLLTGSASADDDELFEK